MSDATVQVTYSIDRRFYYVSGYDFHRPRSWLAIDASADGKFAVLPFAFYEMKSGSKETVSESHELVTRYAQCEEWPERGSKEWCELLGRVRANHASLYASTKSTLDYHDTELQKCDALMKRFG